MRAPQALARDWLGWLVCAAAVLAAAAPLHAQAPAAVNDTYGTAPTTPLTVPAASGVLANDSGAAPLTAVLVATATNGALLLDPNGGFFYLPNIGFTGNDSFTYQAASGSTRSNVATVTIAVNSFNDAPNAIGDSYSTNEGTVLTVAAGSGVLANDSDADGNPLTAVLASAVSSGNLTLESSGAFRYEPAAGFFGNVTFTYLADDGTERSAATTVTIVVNQVNDPPTAQADSYSTAEDTPLVVSAANGVLANDTDPDTGTTLTAALVGSAAHGNVALQADGSFTFTPAANYSGTATFTYQARDAVAASATTTVSITVNPVNDPPFISNAPATTATEGVTYRYTLMASDPEGTVVQVTTPTLPAWLRFTAPATISGTPTQADAGAHDVVMEASDGVAPPSALRFRVTVQAVDNAPTIATIPQQTATEGAALDLDLAQFVTDSDTAAAQLRYAAVGGLPPGLALSSAGRITGTPALGTSVGTHTVRFRVEDAESEVAGQFTLIVILAGRVDLAVTLSAAPSPAPVEAPTTWTIVIANRAPATSAPGVSLSARFAGDVPFRFDAPATSGCTLTPAANQNDLACTLGALAGGATTTITLTGRGGFAGDVFGTATVSLAGGGLDEVPSNDTATASVSLAQRVSSAPAQLIPNVSARAVTAADLNGDGFDDLAVATESGQGLLVFGNVADPANASQRMLTTTPQALGGEPLGNDIAAADIDRDGDVDLVVAAGAGAPDRVYLNGGSSFVSSSLGAANVDSRAVTTGDVNGDAFVDIVIATPTGASLLVNSGSGASFAAPQTVGTGDTRDLLLVDLSGDGLPELVLASGGGNAAVYRNSGAGVFSLEANLATGPTRSVATGDFNADGRADLVFGREIATGLAAPSALVWLNAAGNAGQFFIGDELGAAPTTGTLVRDFNLDGRADVLATNVHGARLFTNAGAANGTLALHPQLLATPGGRGATAGKFSNDERIDVAVVGTDVAVFVNDGAGNFGSGDTTPPTLTLRGEASVSITIDSTYSDAGATATDAVDGDITSRIVVANPVDIATLGTYTITYNVSDLSGNAAPPVTRTVTVGPQAGADGGGGGALGGEVAAALLLAAWLLRRRRALR